MLWVSMAPCDFRRSPQTHQRDFVIERRIRVPHAKLYVFVLTLRKDLQDSLNPDEHGDKIFLFGSLGCLLMP